MKNSVELRRFPYPFRACLSICSDIDETDTADKFLKIQTFMTKTIGIRFTNTFFPFHDNHNFSFLSSGDEDRAIIVNHVQKGEVDAIHSFGERKDFCRQDAEFALSELRRNNCLLDVWIDHAQSASNFCKYRFHGKGDVPRQKSYHFDLLKDYGIKYIWTERLTPIIGQGVALRAVDVLHILDHRRPFCSLLNMLKTIVKIALGRMGYRKYDYMADNSLLKIACMADGKRIYEFARFNNFYSNPSKGDGFPSLHYLISRRVLSILKGREAYSIVYVHLGRSFDVESRDGRRTVLALKNLKREHDRGQIYVATTSTLLNYYVVHKYLRWHMAQFDGVAHIFIDGVDDPVAGYYMPSRERLANITFYVENGKPVKVFLDGKEISELRRNPPDHSARESVTIVTRPASANGEMLDARTNRVMS